MKLKRGEMNVTKERIGVFSGHKFVFTHRDPKTGKYWAESMAGNEDFKGAWIPGDGIRFV